MPDTACIHFCTVSQASETRSELEGTDLCVLRLDASTIDSDDALFGALALSLSFPDYFGRNWDAVDECLRDLSEWMPASGYVLFIEGSSHLWKKATLTAGHLISAWQFCTKNWMAEGKPFHLVFVIDS
ncbi:MAG: barstar family protein [Rhodospirillales bacterium]|nr:barstar family protein [Rhodospirillales bacterium]MBO6788387.1 barstar family protein [Rhodospirillales bacterium]